MRLGYRSWAPHRCGPSWPGLAPAGSAGRIVVQEVLHGICTRPRTHRHGLNAREGFGGEGFAPAGASSAGQHQPRTFAETALAACPSRIGLRPSGTGIHRLYSAWPRVVGQTIQRSGLAPAPNGERAMAPGIPAGRMGGQEGFAEGRTRRTDCLCSAAGSAPASRRADCGSVWRSACPRREEPEGFTGRRSR